MSQDVLAKREGNYKERIHELEGRILQHREEKTFLEQKISELELWKQNAERFQMSSGVPFSMSFAHQQKLDSVEIDNAR